MPIYMLASSCPINVREYFKPPFKKSKKLRNCIKIGDTFYHCYKRLVTPIFFHKAQRKDESVIIVI